MDSWLQRNTERETMIWYVYRNVLLISCKRLGWSNSLLFILMLAVWCKTVRLVNYLSQTDLFYNLHPYFSIMWHSELLAFPTNFCLSVIYNHADLCVCVCVNAGMHCMLPCCTNSSWTFYLRSPQLPRTCTSRMLTARHRLSVSRHTNK